MQSPSGATSFNLAQLCTDQQARDMRGKINSFPRPDGRHVGGGVMLGDSFIRIPNGPADDPTKDGIFLPSWDPGPGGFPEPNGVDPVTGAKLYWLHLRFKNGLVSNVGLMYVEWNNGTPHANTIQKWINSFGS